MYPLISDMRYVRDRVAEYHSEAERERVAHAARAHRRRQRAPGRRFAPLVLLRQLTRMAATRWVASGRRFRPDP
jgi:hypothetical protein